VSLQVGSTPLSYAVSNDHASTVKYLVKVAHADQSKVRQVTITQTMRWVEKITLLYVCTINYCLCVQTPSDCVVYNLKSIIITLIKWNIFI